MEISPKLNQIDEEIASLPLKLCRNVSVIRLTCNKSQFTQKPVVLLVLPLPTRAQTGRLWWAFDVN